MLSGGLPVPLPSRIIASTYVRAPPLPVLAKKYHSADYGRRVTKSITIRIRLGRPGLLRTDPAHDRLSGRRGSLRGAQLDVYELLSRLHCPSYSFGAFFGDALRDGGHLKIVWGPDGHSVAHFHGQFPSFRFLVAGWFQ